MDERDSAYYSNANTDSVYECIYEYDDGYSVDLGKKALQLKTILTLRDKTVCSCQICAK